MYGTAEVLDIDLRYLVHPLHHLDEHKAPLFVVEGRGVASVDFSPDGKLLASGGWDGHVRIREWAAGKQVADFEVGSLARVAFSPAGDLLATVRIVLPEGGDAELEELMRKWREKRPYDPRKGMT